MKESKYWLKDNKLIKVDDNNFKISPTDLIQLIIEIQSDARTDVQNKNRTLLERARKAENKIIKNKIYNLIGKISLIMTLISIVLLIFHWCIIFTQILFYSFVTFCVWSIIYILANNMNIKT